jgi:hypothetical protein
LTTTLYLHTASSAIAGTLPTTSQSTNFTANASFDATTINRSMNTIVGTSQTQLTQTWTSTAVWNIYVTKFVSNPLNQTSIASNTWTVGAGFGGILSAAGRWPGSSTITPSKYPSTLYVWRPSTGALIGTIFDAISATGSNYLRDSAETAVIVTFTGSPVTCIVGDVLIFEQWGRVNATSSQNYFYYFDGTNTTFTDSTTQTSIASYIQTPETISFSIPPVVCTPTGKTVINKFISKH